MPKKQNKKTKNEKNELEKAGVGKGENVGFRTKEIEKDIKLRNASLLSYLNQFYIESRYPGNRIQLTKELNKNKAQDLLNETKEARKWLEQQLP